MTFKLIFDFQTLTNQNKKKNVKFSKQIKGEIL